MQYFLDTIETIEPGHGFTHFDGYHFLWLGILVVFAGLMAWQYRKRDAETRAKWRKRVAVAILLDEVWKMFWLTVGGTYTLEYLPLHLCSINIILIAIHAWKPGKILDNFLYAICIPVFQNSPYTAYIHYGGYVEGYATYAELYASAQLHRAHSADHLSCHGDGWR